MTQAARTTFKDASINRYWIEPKNMQKQWVRRKIIQSFPSKQWRGKCNCLVFHIFWEMNQWSTRTRQVELALRNALDRSSCHLQPHYANFQSQHTWLFLIKRLNERKWRFSPLQNTVADFAHCVCNLVELFRPIWIFIQANVKLSMNRASRHHKVPTLLW